MYKRKKERKKERGCDWILNRNHFSERKGNNKIVKKRRKERKKERKKERGSDWIFKRNYINERKG